MDAPYTGILDTGTTGTQSPDWGTLSSDSPMSFDVTGIYASSIVQKSLLWTPLGPSRQQDAYVTLSVVPSSATYTIAWAQGISGWDGYGLTFSTPSTFRLQRFTAGGGTQLAVHTYTMLANDTMWIQVDTPWILAHIQKSGVWTPAMQVKDTTYGTGGQVAFVGTDSGGTKAKWINIGGGSPGGGQTPSVVGGRGAC